MRTSRLLDSVVGEPVGQRKLRLFAVACCRRILPHLSDGRSRLAVEVAERYCDNHATFQQMMTAREAAFMAANEMKQRDWPNEVVKEMMIRASGAAYHATTEDAEWAARKASDQAARVKALELIVSTPDRQMKASELPELLHGEEEIQCEIIRDIFAPTGLQAASVPQTAIAFAKEIYAERTFDKLPLLANLLEQEGYASPVLTAHCRSQALHVRGCWAMDALLSND